MLCHQTFVIHFQPLSNGSISPSTDEWIEFTNEIHPSQQFTACHWIKAKYFNRNIQINLWSYCTMESVNDAMKCVQIYLDQSLKSAARNLEMTAEIPYTKGRLEISMEVKPFLHRAWVHFCWSFSGSRGENRFYYNGHLLGIDTVLARNNTTIIKDSTKMFDSALIFGQEPDKMRGEFEKFQAFIGDLAEFNLWNYMLDDKHIIDMAQCKDWTKGNVVAWDKDNITAHNVDMEDLWNASTLCSEQQTFVIFPERVTFAQAKQTCAVYGGKIAVPLSLIHI